MSLAVLFPGQGSQFIGMGAGLFQTHAELLGDTADEILGWSLEELCVVGPEERLTRTEYAQPALFAISYALWSELTNETDIEFAGAAGHSLGEFTALAAAGALSFVDALDVVAKRGEAMAEAADLEPSGMAALIGVSEEIADDVVARNASEGGRLQVANLNAPGQVVVAGSADDIDWLTGNARELGVRRVIPLKVAGGFHSAFMEPAAGSVSDALSGVSIQEPRFPVWSNTTGRPHVTADLVATLRSQVVSTVRFSDCLTDMAGVGIDTFVHVGPGDITAGMVKRTVEGASAHVVASAEDIPGVVDSLVSMAELRSER